MERIRKIPPKYTHDFDFVGHLVALACACFRDIRTIDPIRILLREQVMNIHQTRRSHEYSSDSGLDHTNISFTIILLEQMQNVGKQNRNHAYKLLVAL